MAQINDPDNLTQGASTAVSDAAWGTPSSRTVTITSAGTNLPAISAGDFFEVRDHSNTQNNGLYQESGGSPGTGSITADKISGSPPVTAGAEAVTTLGNTTTPKNIFYDTAALKVYLLEKNGLSADGAATQAVYSNMKINWKDDNFLIANAPFPMICIDADAGKYVIGVDSSGNSNGWSWEDDVTYSIRTRKLLRNGGWAEQDANGIIKAVWPGIITLGDFEDAGADTAYYQFGDDTTVDDTVDFDFAGPVNEAVKAFDELGNPDTCTFTASTITRATGSFITDGYKVGGQVTIRASSSNDGTYTITGVAALTLTVSGTPFSAGADAAAQLAVDNLNSITLRLRVRDADTYGKTFSQANLTSAGKAALNNYVFSFPLGNATDLKIEATDATITGSSPYTGMSITYYATPQSKSGLVGGSFDFGIVVTGNNGTGQQVYEFVQYQLRQTTDIDADADTAIGRTMDGLMRFVGDTLEVGSTDGGATFPTNPDGGGSGVFIDGLNAASKNDVLFFDNTGTARTFPETIPVTIDFNQTIIDDTVAEYTLFYDRTIRTPSSSLTDLVVTAGTGSAGTISSAGSNLPTNAQISVGKYVRISNYDADMDGVYQITAINTAGQNWSVERYDSKTVVTTASGGADLDQNCIDTPDAIIVQDDVPADVTGLANADVNFSFDFDGNTQGGRVVSTNTYVQCKVIGQSGAQYAISTVQVIQSGTPLTIPVSGNIERNYNNP